MKTRTAPSLDFKWPGVGEYGIVSIDSIMPNPLNPRWNAADDVGDLAEAIRKDDQREIVTVRPTTAEEQETHPDIRYVLISGERRYHSSIKAGKTSLEIRVKAYESRAREMQDMFQLNENRRPLSDLENAKYIARLAEEFGWETQTEIAAGTGKAQVEVSRLLAVARCAPSVHARMDPSMPEHQRLGVQVAVLLSKLSTDMQDQLMHDLPDECDTGVAQIAWIKARLDVHGVALARRTRNPQNKRRMLKTLANSIERKSRDILAEADLGRLFENTSDGDAEELAVSMRNALIELERLVNRVEELSLKDKPTTTLIPRKPEQVSSQKTAAPPVYHHKQQMPAQAPRASPSTATVATRRLTIERWDDSVCRFIMDNVDMETYRKYWTQGILKFQRNKTPKPEHYPDPKIIA